MYKRSGFSSTSIVANNSSEGETIEQKVDRVVNNKEPITDGAPIIFTERKDGVMPGFDIRTDRFEVAIEAMDKLDSANKAKRQEGIDSREKVVKDYNEGQKSGEKSGETTSTQGTNGDSSK